VDKSDVAVGIVLVGGGMVLVLNSGAREWLASAWAKQQRDHQRRFPRWPGSGALTSKESWRMLVLLIGGGLVFAGLLVIVNAWD
jgi:hypothetical protein